MNARSNRETICGEYYKLGRIYPDKEEKEVQVQVTFCRGIAKEDIFKCNRTEKNKKKLCGKGEEVFIMGDSYAPFQYQEGTKVDFLIFTKKGKLLRDGHFLDLHVGKVTEPTTVFMTSNRSGQDVNGKEYQMVCLMNNEKLKVWILKNNQINQEQQREGDEEEDEGEGENEVKEEEAETIRTSTGHVSATPQYDLQSNSVPDEHWTRQQELRQLQHQCYSHNGYLHYYNNISYCNSLSEFLRTQRGVFYVIPGASYAQRAPYQNQQRYLLPSAGLPGNSMATTLEGFPSL